MIATDLRCADCGAAMTYRPSGQWGPWYACVNYPACKGAHGAHPDGRPLGNPANAATRAARIRAHDAFDRLWKNAPSKRRSRKRHAMYKRLREHLGMSWDECHIGQFTIEQCDRVSAWADSLLAERKEKRSA